MDRNGRQGNVPVSIFFAMQFVHCAGGSAGADILQVVCGLRGKVCGGAVLLEAFG